MEDVLPFYLTAGVTYERFMDSCPVELKPFEKAFDLKQKQIDEQMFLLGRYFYEAVVIGVDNAMRGNKSNLEYRTKSFSAEREEAELLNEPLTGRRLAAERQKLIDGLNSMKLRFEAGKIRREGE